MTVLLEEAVARLNITSLTASLVEELVLYVDAANEWVASKVTDTDTSRARLATLELVDHLWSSSQRGPGSASPFGSDETSIVVGGYGYAIPNRVKELLDLHPPGPSGSFPAAECWPDPQLPRWGGYYEFGR